MFPPSGAQSGGAPIRATDNDAAVARLSAVQKHYLQDPYIKHLVPRAHLLPPHPPLINIGTYVRTAAIDSLVDQWLQLASNAGQKCQIAGSLEDNLQVYVEVDFPEITTKKAMAIKKHKELVSLLGDPSQVSLAQGGTALRSPKYYLIPTDIRRPPSEMLESFLYSSFDAEHPAILDPSIPTLLLFECVLAYMSPVDSSRLLDWFVKVQQKHNGVLGCIVYEMFGLNDSFGRVMVNNLKERGISLPGADPYPTVENLPNRFLQTGFSAAHGLTLKEIRRAYIEPSELERHGFPVETLSFLLTKGRTGSHTLNSWTK
ncbi:unnamed protein product [Cyclocybe aegerita]|uniref:Leucine carboxyl methyltransferase 1 n=1 Tax=Cyclocybe aegerita TaxID=1973307 RepID=A0A8S0W6B9_CYCAE|nr:unnamed protein product [Cyclocybe aegerita]